MATIRIALIGDYNPKVKAHIAIPIALQMACDAAGCEVEPAWCPTESLEGDPDGRLADYDGVWCVPGSPFVSMQGALEAIRFARERRRPFLGTCGGFQHALIEYARNVLGLAEADHAESSPDASVLFISPLTCPLVGAVGTIALKPGSRIAAIYGAAMIEEEYHCSFGLNPAYQPLLDSGSLSITGVDTNGEVRVVELADHPFFIGTLYQPERAALRGITHPLVNAYEIGRAHV